MTEQLQVQVEKEGPSILALGHIVMECHSAYLTAVTNLNAFLSFNVIMFDCPELGCDQIFSSERGLAMHRHFCTFADEGIGISASEALKRLEEKRTRKRRKIHQLEVPEEQDFPMFEEPILENTLPAESVSYYNSDCFVDFIILS